MIALSGRSVEAAGDISTLLLDKTGTITLGNRRATEFLPAPGVSVEDLRDVARLASLADLTPEGRSIVELALAQGASGADLPTGQRGRRIHRTDPDVGHRPRRRGTAGMRKGAGSAVAAWLGHHGSHPLRRRPWNGSRRRVAHRWSSPRGRATSVECSA